MHRLYRLFPHEKYIATLEISVHKTNKVKTISTIYAIKAKCLKFLYAQIITETINNKIGKAKTKANNHSNPAEKLMASIYFSPFTTYIS